MKISVSEYVRFRFGLSEREREKDRKKLPHIEGADKASLAAN